jgi:hypothetical protein
VAITAKYHLMQSVNNILAIVFQQSAQATQPVMALVTVAFATMDMSVT